MTESQPRIPMDENLVVLATTTLEKALRKFDLTALWSDNENPESSSDTLDDKTQRGPSCPP